MLLHHRLLVHTPYCQEDLCYYRLLLSHRFARQALTRPRINICRGIQNPKSSPILDFSLAPRSTRSRPGRERIRKGEGCWSRPPNKKIWPRNPISKRHDTAVPTIGQTIRGGHDKKRCRDEVKCQIGNYAKLDFFPIVYFFNLSTRQDPKKNSRVSPKIQNLGHFSLVSLNPVTVHGQVRNG